MGLLTSLIGGVNALDADDGENPFADDSPPRPPRPGLGVPCIDCGDEAQCLMDESFGHKHEPVPVCYPDAYHRAH